jgi:hypothetical protein
VVALLSNSQGTSAGVRPEEAYPVLLGSEMAHIVELHRITIGGWKMDDFLNILDDNVIAIRPDIVLIQAGIMECTQRILSLFEKRILHVIPLGTRIPKWVYKHRALVLKIRSTIGIATRLQSVKNFFRACEFFVGKNNICRFDLCLY